MAPKDASWTTVFSTSCALFLLTTAGGGCPQGRLVPHRPLFSKRSLFLLNPTRLPSVAQVAVAPKDASYVKDDFFDQLSCDTLERLHLQEEGGETCCSQSLQVFLAVNKLCTVCMGWLGAAAAGGGRRAAVACCRGQCAGGGAVRPARIRLRLPPGCLSAGRQPWGTIGSHPARCVFMADQ